MDKVQLQQIEDRYKASSASSAASIDPALARRICEALGQPVSFMHKTVLQRLARQLAQEYLFSDMKALIHAARLHEHQNRS
ncbi:MAG: hypothetical protein AAGF95_34925 [Chloroflexota bacterium]